VKQEADKIVKDRSLKTIAKMQKTDLPIEVRVAMISLCLGIAQGIAEAFDGMQIDKKHIDVVMEIIREYFDGVQEIMELGGLENVDTEPNKE
jgi:hypothetical protein